MSDLFTPYENGMAKLLEMMGENHPEEAGARTLESRLRENIWHARSIYDDDANKGRRFALLYDLNHFAKRTVNQNFNQLCGLNHYPQPPPPNAHDYLTSAYSYITLVRNVAENAQSFFHKKLWKTDCEDICDSLQKIGKPDPYNNRADNQAIDAAQLSLQTRLYYMSSNIDELERLVTAFCPYCRETSEAVKEEQQMILKKLQSLLRKDVKDATDQLNVCIGLFERI